MTAMLDFRTIRGIIARPFRLEFADGEFVVHESASRRPLILHWRRGEDGHLESRWDCED